MNQSSTLPWGGLQGLVILTHNWSKYPPSPGFNIPEGWGKTRYFVTFGHLHYPRFDKHYETMSYQASLRAPDSTSSYPATTSCLATSLSNTWLLRTQSTSPEAGLQLLWDQSLVLSLKHHGRGHMTFEEVDIECILPQLLCTRHSEVTSPEA